MSLWSFFRDLIIFDWLFGDHRCHHNDNSVIPPIGGYYNSMDDGFPWYSTHHDGLMDDRDDYGGIGGYDSFESSSSDFFDDDDY